MSPTGRGPTGQAGRCSKHVDAQGGMWPKPIARIRLPILSLPPNPQWPKWEPRCGQNGVLESREPNLLHKPTSISHGSQTPPPGPGAPGCEKEASLLSRAWFRCPALSSRVIPLCSWGMGEGSVGWAMRGRGRESRGSFPDAISRSKAVTKEGAQEGRAIPSYDGLDSVPQVHIHPEPQNGALIGNGVLAEVIVRLG